MFRTLRLVQAENALERAGVPDGVRIFLVRRAAKTEIAARDGLIGVASGIADCRRDHAESTGVPARRRALAMGLAETMTDQT